MIQKWFRIFFSRLCDTNPQSFISNIVCY